MNLDINKLFKNNPKQIQALYALFDLEHTEILYGGGKGGGKSILGATFCVLSCFLYQEIDIMVLRDTSKNLKESVIKSIFEVLKLLEVGTDEYSYNATELKFTFKKTSSTIFTKSLEKSKQYNYEDLRGIPCTFAWCDEAATIPNKAIEELNTIVGRKNKRVNKLELPEKMRELYPNIAGEKNSEIIPKILYTSNPGKNYIYQIYKKPKEGQIFIQALPTDNYYLYKTNEKDEREVDENGNPIPTTILDKYLNLTGILRKLYLLGEWEFDTQEGQLIPNNKIDEMFVELIEKPKPNFVTCDPAFSGKDTAQILLWHDLTVTETISYYKSTAAEITAKLKELQAEYGILDSQIVIDSTGNQIYESFSHVSSKFIASGKSTDPSIKYQNLRNQCYFKLSELIVKEKIKVNTSDYELKMRINEELSHIIRDTSKDKTAIYPKEWIKSKIGYSPDIADCLMIRMVTEVQPLLNSNFNYF